MGNIFLASLKRLRKQKKHHWGNIAGIWGKWKRKWTHCSILGLYRDNGKKMETSIVDLGDIGIMEKKIGYFGFRVLCRVIALLKACQGRKRNTYG